MSEDRFNQINSVKYSRELTQSEKMDYLGYKFYNSMGYNLDFNAPRTFTEKLNWLKVFYQNPKARSLADKASFPHYIKTLLPDFAGHLAPHLSVFNSVAEFANLHFPKLPWNFVAKSSFGSGAQEFVNKTYASMGRLKSLIASWLNPLSNQYYYALENSYKDIQPSVVCEPLLQIDYGMYFFCFNGEPLYYWIVLGQKGGVRRNNIYSIDGKRVPTRWGNENFETEPPSPPFLDEMIHCAKIIAKNFPHARVDFNICGKTWLFSEVTFFSWAGLKGPSDYSFDLELGNHINLEALK